MKSPGQIRRPLVAIALSVAGGLWLERITGLQPILFLGLCSLLCAGLYLRFSSAVFYPALALLAAAWGGIHLMQDRPVFLQAAAGETESALVGTVLDDSFEPDGPVSFRLKTEAVQVEGGWFEHRGVFQVYLRNPSGPVVSGQKREVRGRCMLYERPRSGVSGSMHAGTADSCRLLSAPKSLRTGSLERFRRSAARRLEYGAAPDSIQVPLLSALLLGYRQALPETLHRAFSQTGTVHIFAISGLHVGIIASILIAVLKTAGVCRRYWGLVLVPVLFLYVISTGMKPSALRAFTMAAVYFSAPLAGRRPDAPSSIALAAILLLLFSPQQIGDPGFLLSFTVVSGIVMAHGFVIRQKNGPGRTVRLPQSPRRRILAEPVRRAGLLAVTSFAAWLFSMPLTARFFNIVSPLAPAGNFFMIPLVFIMVLTGCLTLLAGPFFLPATVFLNQANGVFTGFLVRCIERIAELPGSRYFVVSPPDGIIILWYIGLVLFLTGPFRLRKLSVCMLAGAILLWQGGVKEAVADKIEWYHQNRFAAVFLLPPDRPVLVVGGDGSQNGNTIRQLQKQGINRLYAVVVSDSNFSEETLLQIKKDFRPRQVWRPGQTPEWSVGEGTVRLTARNTE